MRSAHHSPLLHAPPFRFLRDDPVRILVQREEQTLDGIKQVRRPSLRTLFTCLTHTLHSRLSSQFYVLVDREENKLEVLCDLYSTISVAQAIIFASPSSYGRSTFLIWEGTRMKRCGTWPLLSG